MNTPFPTLAPNVIATSSLAKTPSLPSWLREPLLHFIVLGGVLFGIDYFLVGRADDPRTIVVGADVDKEAREVFKASRGQEPTETELSALRRVWLDNEVLYREGLALEVDKGDTAIRERVIFKALSVIDANVKLPAVDDATLRSWFEKHRDKYDEPARFDFQEAVLAENATENAVSEFAYKLNHGTPGDAQAGLRVFKGRPHGNLVQSYGPVFAEALENSRIGEWRAIKTQDGWRAMQLNSITAPKPAVYEVFRGVLLQDWKDEMATEQRTAAVRALTKKYKVKHEAAAQ